MTVTFFLDRFPNYSETFVIHQIVGLIDRGLDVKIVSVWPGDYSKKHAVVEDYDLLSRTRYLLPAEDVSGEKKIKKRFFSILHDLNKIPVLRCLNFFKYGRHSLNLLLPYILSKNSDQIVSDCFIAHFGTVGVLANKLRDLGLLHGKLATVFHGLDVSHTKTISDYRKDYKDLFVKGELILPISELWAEKLAGMGCDKSKIHVCRMGIDINQFTFKLRNKVNSPLEITSVCRLIEKKGLEYALHACAELKRRGVDYHFSIVGTGPLEASLVHLIDELALQGSVTMEGFKPQEKVREMLESSDVFLLPSVTAANGDMEGIPVALMEAMSTGLPVVSTRHSGIPELIEDKKSGWLADEKNFTQLADIIQGIAQGTGAVYKITLEARKVIETKFNQEILNDKLVELIKHG
ncbi:glycosyltransferase [Serratia liquefaciens]|uniref:Glycosyltransferase n=1 Tax=Serratia liquefaciens TaxID=614 RepID=A0ABX7CZ80_SERLI|nr:glycosyltransferase [Serratia liquefaciens]AYO37044.1 glycosyltransferase [Serratia sp. P2ACOL2]QQU53898.1 glycosyltransferase [Serratia liquefaciens]